MNERKPQANNRQVGGKHYMNARFRCACGREHEHWDIAWGLRWDSFMYPITKYLWRWKDKAGVEDLEKAAHYLEKYIETVKGENPEPVAPTEPPPKYLHPYAAADAEQAELNMSRTDKLMAAAIDEECCVPLSCSCADNVRNDQVHWTCPAHGNMNAGSE